MDARDTLPPSSAGVREGIKPLHILWLLSPLAYPMLHWIAPAVPEALRLMAGFVLLFILPGWLLHLLILPRVRIGLSARITRAFALSVGVISVLGMIAWFFGGGADLGAIPVPGGSPPIFMGRLTALIWGEALVLFTCALLILVRAASFRGGHLHDGGTVGQRRSEKSEGMARSESGNAQSDQGGRNGQERKAEDKDGKAGNKSGEKGHAVETSNPVMQRIFREAYRLGDQHKADHPVAPRWATLLVLGAMVLFSSILGFYTGGFFGYQSDAPDHLACIREMVERDLVLPRAVFYMDGDGATVDARKGFYHVGLALLAKITRLDPVHMWKLVLGMLAPLALIVFHTFARKLLRSEGTALFATFLAFICFGEVTRGQFTRLGYGSQMGIVLAWSALAMALEYVMYNSRRTLLWLAAFASFAAAATHLFAAIHILFSLGVFFVAMLVFRGVHNRGLKRVGLALLASAGGCLPALIWRLLFTYSPLNPIHTHRQGMLSFGDHLSIIMPMGWGSMLMGVGLGGTFLSLFLWKQARQDDAVLYMASLSLAPLLIVANPVLIPLLEPLLGYLVTRFVVTIPFLMVLAYVARWMGEHLLELNSLRRVVTSLLFYIFMVWLLFPRLEAFAGSYATGNMESLRGRSVYVWKDLLDELDERISSPSVVLSDPLTSYSIPALTRHYTVSVLHQHGSPSDSMAVERLKACRDVLSPYLGAGEKARLCRRFNVDYILVNGALERGMDLFYCNVGPGLASVQKAALMEESSLFQLVWDAGVRGGLFRVCKENLDALSGIVTPGQNRPTGRTTEELTRSILLRELPGDVIPVISDTVAGITLVAAAMDTTWASRGEWVGLTFYWQRVGVPPRFPVEISICLNTQAPRGLLWSLSLSRVHRIWVELREGVKYQNRLAHIPLRGMFGVDHWPTDRFVVDRFSIRVPKRVATSQYEVKVEWDEQTFLPNSTLGRQLSDRDVYDRLTVGLLEVY
ncbi:MAG: hypothetical protein KAY24_17130 [Candidatus Eisenbacteria sp.]|nr:hypothetical protein [Candidatus Eisenbacteria bacterium]